MRKGLPKSIIKKYGISKKAWRVYRGKKGKKRTRRARRSSNPKRRVRRIGRRKKRRGGGKSLQKTVFKWLRITSLVAPGVAAAKHGLDSGWGWEGALDQVCQVYSGYSFVHRNFDMKRLASGWTPFLLTTLMTALIPKISGIIRRI